MGYLAHLFLLNNLFSIELYGRKKEGGAKVTVHLLKEISDLYVLASSTLGGDTTSRKWTADLIDKVADRVFGAPIGLVAHQLPVEDNLRATDHHKAFAIEWKKYTEQGYQLVEEDFDEMADAIFDVLKRQAILSIAHVLTIEFYEPLIPEGEEAPKQLEAYIRFMV